MSELENAPALVDNVVPAPTPCKYERRKENTQKEHGRKIQKMKIITWTQAMSIKSYV